MINRNFYRFSEVVERLDTDAESLRQAVALGKVSVFLEFNSEPAFWVCGSKNEAGKSDPYCSWWVDRISARFDDDGEPTNRSELRPSKISGWYRVSENGAREAARSGYFADGRYVAPSFVNPDFAPWDLWFLVKDTLRTFTDCAWFLVSEIESLSSPDSLMATKWPWGDHETDLLRHLAAAAREWWSTYDMEKPGTAPTNEKVADWLVRERRVSRRNAEVMASILRADDLKDGPRPRR